MGKHRIGSDLAIRWRMIDANGAPYDLSSMDIKVEMYDAIKRRRAISNYTIAENSTIAFTFAAIEQRMLGMYALVAYINKGKAGQVVVDACNCFELVECMHQEGDQGAGGLVVEYEDMVSTIVAGVQGKSAYASWLSAGHQGTEADFISWLQKPAVDAAKIAQEYNDHQPVVGSNGNWWVWDATSDAYIDTNHPSKGDVCYPTFHVNADMELVVSKPAAVPEGMFRMEDGDLIMRV